MKQEKLAFATFRFTIPSCEINVFLSSRLQAQLTRTQRVYMDAHSLNAPVLTGLNLPWAAMLTLDVSDDELAFRLIRAKATLIGVYRYPDDKPVEPHHQAQC